MLFPRIVCLVYPQTLKQLLLTLKYLVQRGDQETLPKPSRSGKKIYAFGIIHKIENLLGLVYIQIIVLNNITKCLYPYGKSFHKSIPSRPGTIVAENALPVSQFTNDY